MTVISASILNGDLAHLADEAAAVRRFGADMLHYDVMDGMFVDNLSFGLPVLECLRRCTDLPIDAHLMITAPHRFIERFAKAGADQISFHIESDSDAAETVRLIHGQGLRAGIAVSPDTPAEAVFPVMHLLAPDDFILVMTVYPGLGGQSFIPETLPKMRTLREKIRALGIPLHIQVDGGINAETGAKCREAGADNLVAGSYLLRSEDPVTAVRLLRG